MKKYFILIATAILATLAACSIEEPFVPENTEEEQTQVQTGPREITIRASQESQDGTKTVRDEGTGASLWSPYDAICVFYGSGSAGGSRFVFTTGTVDSAIAEFTGTIDTSTPDLEFWGLYPYDSAASCDGSSITTTIPSSQNGLFRIFPAIGHSSTQDMAFYNVCGGLCFSVKRADISRITIRSNNGESLAGRVRIGLASDGKTPEIKEVLSGTDVITITTTGYFTPDVNYYVTILPGSLTGGFTMTFETPVREGSYNRTKSTAINRSRFGGLAGIDEAASVVFSYKGGNISVPDAAFKAYLVSNYDSNSDGEISYAEADAVTTISMAGGALASLEGIECLQNLTTLSVTGMTSLTVADVTFNSSLTSVNLSNNALTGFRCSDLPVTALDVSGNAGLKTLYADRCNLSSLNVTGCTALTTLSCGYGNSLTTVDVSTCPNLEMLFLREIGTISSLDVSNNPKLRSLNVVHNQLTSIDVSANTSLRSFYCEDNLLTALNVTNNTALRYLHCGQNSLTTLDVSSNSSLSTLNCSESPSLTEIWLKTGQTISTFTYDTAVATVKYKD